MDLNRFLPLLGGMDLNRLLPYVYVVIATFLLTWHLWSLMKRSRSPRYPESSDYHEGDEAEASSPPSSSSPPVKEDGFQYHVFLSFRGPDTRKSFTSHLYYALEEKGIVTFMDSEKLEKGQKMRELFERIERSKIFVPIFSEGYANSEWCLEEIAKMVEYDGRLIIPVFFGVKPRDVRRQTGPFEDAFRSWDKKKNKDKVSKWRAALTEAGEVKGYELADTNGELAKDVWLIVKRILKEVNKTPLDVAKHPVGLDPRIADVMKLLDVEAQGEAKMVGIYGMGGMGKTTLAKAVYNQIYTLFDACSFISNVREVAKQPNGLVFLQKQILYDLLGTDDGIIKERIGSKKVLLVLDDVDQKSQLDALAGGVNWFSPGSRIIITTRDKQILMAQSVLNLYEVKGLDATQSLQLFSCHAFGEEEPNAKFADLSKEVAATAAGLPLALEIFGSHFSYLQTITQWSDMLEMMKKDHEEDIHRRLRISFDALNEEEKKVFLDIACFFIGNGRKFATFMWEGCEFSPNITIDVLVKTSLVNINDDTKEFEMHDHIRDMGRKIVEEESLHDEGMCNSRLWKDADETLDVLKDKREMKNVEAIQLFCEDFMSVSEEPFAAMFQLRMLRLGSKVQLEGRHEHFPSNLKWLEWHPSDLDSLPDGRYLENIVVLDLSESNITQLWNPQTSARTKAFGKLKALKLVDCYNLTSCPDFKSMPHLQELNLGGCGEMSELHPSIGHLKGLYYLNLSGCKSLKELSEEVGQLTSLRILTLDSCSQISTLPESMGYLKQLKRLSLSKCFSLKEVPKCIVSLDMLEELTVSGCVQLKFLPQLPPSLTKLDTMGCHQLKIIENVSMN